MEAAKNIMPDDIRDICQRCAHRDTCKVLCYPVLLYLYRSQEPVVEYMAKRREGEKVIVVFPRHKEIQGPALERRKFFFDQLFSTENPLWEDDSGLDKNLLLTRIFADKFFKKDSFKDIAMRYDMPVQTVRRKYDQALRTITNMLQFFYSVSVEEKAKTRTEHKKKALTAMQALKAKGMSNKQIADYLTARKFPTHYKAARPGSWSKSTVQRYLAEV